jgi:hypothetical protein
MTNRRIESSFRDPSGFLFLQNDILYRQINQSYKENYDHLMDSGLYKKLVDTELLIPHQEVNIMSSDHQTAYKIIQPEVISFISYPYEWCFSQIKQAALATIEIQKIALEHGMTLKDCSAYNIQFRNYKAVLIDTLSFEKYQEGQIWKGYRQFCQHFLAPLALMSHRDIRLNQLLRIYIDGIPLDLADKLLPMRTHSMFSLFAHIHAHAKSQKRYEDKEIKVKDYNLSKRSFIGIIESLHSTIKKQNWHPEGTEWGDYYLDTNYSESSFEQKKKIISSLLEKINPKSLWDIGSNTGIFSRIASKRGIQTISFDVDPVAVEKNFLECIEKKDANLLPLLIDLTNPSPDIGWHNQERSSFTKRGPADAILALALIHHLAISNNVPLDMIGEFFAKNCKHLIIEFVPKEDSQVRRLLATREDVFTDYTQDNFETQFKKFFTIQDKLKIDDSQRTIYYMQKTPAS